MKLVRARRSLHFSALHLLAVAFAVVGVLAVGPLRFLEAQAPQKVVPNPDGVYAGLFNISDPLPAYERFTENSAGRTAPIVFTFHDWNGAGVEALEPTLQSFDDPLEGEGSPSPRELATRVAQDGGVVALAWDAVGYFFEHPDYFNGGGTMAVRWDDLFAGQYDDYIREFARDVKDYGGPIMLSPAAEFNAIGYFSFGPNGDRGLNVVDADELTRHYGDPDAPDGPERIRDLYRHVIDIFNEEGANNVTWFMYSHTGYLNPADLDEIERERIDFVHPRHYYPGDEYIDWIGNSIYVDADNPEQDLSFAIDASLEAFREITDKPFFSPEFGVVSASGADRSERLRQLFLEELPKYPDLQALAFADAELFEQFFGVPRLGHVEEELEAWREAVWESGLYTNQILTAQIPEPSTAVLVSLGVLGVGCRRRGHVWRPRDGR